MSHGNQWGLTRIPRHGELVQIRDHSAGHDMVGRVIDRTGIDGNIVWLRYLSPANGPETTCFIAYFPGDKTFNKLARIIDSSGRW